MSDEERPLMERLQKHVGVDLGAPRVARDPVNQPMIRHWCDAIGDRNPVYTDPEFARGSLHGGIVAPPTMLQAWLMPGLLPKNVREARAFQVPGVLNLLDEAGFSSVVATNSTQEYVRYLRPGDELTVSSSIESVSEEKRTGLGAGHFVTQLMTYRDQQGEVVASMRFRLLKFRPPERMAEERAKPAARATRSRPRSAITRDNQFFWDGIDRGVLLIQRCDGCQKLRHPPGPMCPACQSLEWSAIEACGRGTVYSHVTAHHPPISPFEYPNVIVLVELEEGTRIVSNLLDVPPDAVRIGMPVVAEITEVERDRMLLQFRSA